MKKFLVKDLERLQQEFYRSYNPDYWLCKMQLLKNSHDNFESLKEILKIGIDVDDAHYTRVLRTELHFLYFQMTEALFEIVFAIARHDNRNLWLSLTVSDWRSNYEEIADFSSKSDIFTRDIDIEIVGVKTKIPLLRWIFYFNSPSKMNESEWKTNLANITKLLVCFAKDFSNRDEYNAYKHALRFYTSPFSVQMWRNDKPFLTIQNDSRDSVTYLKTRKETLAGEGGEVSRLISVTKSFDFERDYHCCLLIYELISNVINPRKHALLKELSGKEFQSTIFCDSERLNIYPTGRSQVEFAV